MTVAISIDFETASTLDLTKVGAYKYAAHPTTFVRCMAWKRHDIDAAGVWRPGWRITAELEAGLREGEVHAWNAQFERLIFAYQISPQRLPHPTYNQWRCTAAQARQNALPGKLDKCAKLLDTEHKKLSPALMKKLADAAYTPTSVEMVSLAEYCMYDVLTEMDIGEKLPPWTPDELYAYRHNERINDRGVMLDTDFIERMIAYLMLADKEINDELACVTNGNVTAYTQVPALKEWLGHHGSLDAARIEMLLARPEHLTKAQRRALELRQMGAKASAKKYIQMLNRVSPDGRLRGMFVYSGAGQTGRYSSTGVQLHNLVRDVPKDAALRIESIKTMDYEGYKLMYPEPIIHQAGQLVRPAIVAPEGRKLVIGDFSAVEAKGLPWLASVKHEIDAWAAGADRYVEDAANVFGKPEEDISPEERQAGKVVRLACGFSGKGGALMAMAKGYGMDLSEDQAKRMAHAWHAANPWVEQFARTLWKAAVAAVQEPGTVYPAGEHIKYGCEVRDGVKILRCALPSGRIISYHDVTAVYDSKWGEFAMTSIKPRTGQREKLWHGLLAENVTQAVCNDLMRYAIATLHKEGFAIVAHVHDEAVCEVRTSQAEQERDRMKEQMEILPAWAEGFPLTAKVDIADRYTK